MLFGTHTHLKDFLFSHTCMSAALGSLVDEVRSGFVLERLLLGAEKCHNKFVS